ncbi:MAG: adenylate/guanylate cyclase domain-containing protein [Treponema sp.]|jgi:class 3 adenylate cyclase|nr:adenylate/guanylate cyclase domain-containing protein [Treponema sp.]
MMEREKFKGFVKAIGGKLILGMFLASAFMVVVISDAVNFQMSNYETSVFETTQRHLLAAARTLANLVSAEELDLFHTLDDTQNPLYEELKQKLIKFSEDYEVLYAYYWRDYRDGMLQYIIDNDTDPETQVSPESIFEIEETALNALAGKTGVTDLGAYTPTWDGLITAYAPVYDNEGKFYCVAGVDISDSFIMKQHEGSRKMTIVQLISVPLSVIFGVFSMLLYRRKARQIEEAHVKLQYFNNNLRRAFSTYLSEDVVEEIVSDPTRLQLGGEKRHMTALFTDVQKFTPIAEALSPEQLVELLNYYLSTMSDVILEQQGTIDKYEGDAIVSFFGAPLILADHALRACITAIMMKRLEADVNRYISENDLSPSPLYTRIGINSGDMVVGNMGTQKKMNYTIVSSAVNLAARLEGVNKQYGTWILAAESTINETEGKLLTRRLDKIRVVGIKEPVRIYEILETADAAKDSLFELANLFSKAHGIFESHDWKGAETAFRGVLEKYPADGPSRLYLDLSRQYQARPPADKWDGVFNIKEK